MLVREIFRVLADLRRGGLSILLVEQNVHAALDISTILVTSSNWGRSSRKAASVELARDPRILRTYLGQRQDEL